MTQETSPAGDRVDKDKVSAWLGAKWKALHNCPISGDNNWSIADHIVQSMTYVRGGGLAIGGPGYPVVMVVCLSCGYTLFFNAVVMGLVEGDRGNS